MTIITQGSRGEISALQTRGQVAREGLSMGDSKPACFEFFNGEKAIPASGKALFAQLLSSYGDGRCCCFFGPANTLWAYKVKMKKHIILADALHCFKAKPGIEWGKILSQEYLLQTVPKFLLTLKVISKFKSAG